MVRGLNKVQLIGNLGGDPELRYTPGGQAVAHFTVAVGRSRKGPDGERREETEWFRVVAWEKLAETCAEYLSKGRQVYVEGRLQSRQYTDKEGNRRTAVEVIASEMLMLGRPGGAAGAEGAEGERAPMGAGAAAHPGAAPGEDWGDVPF